MNGSELPAYDLFKTNLVNQFNQKEDSFVTHLICGTLAGIVGAIATSPAEVVKNRYDITIPFLNKVYESIKRQKII